MAAPFDTISIFDAKSFEFNNYNKNSHIYHLNFYHSK
jgi:hypothetical protein